MSRPNTRRLFAALEATWPAASTRRLGPVVLRDGQGGGGRVSAATVEGPFEASDIDAAEAAMKAAGEVPLWQIRPGDSSLDAELARRGHAELHQTLIYSIPVREMALEPPRVSAFVIWPPLAIMTEIFEDGGINAARRAVMHRAGPPRTGILGRASDQPAGAAFVAVSDGIAYLHALHVLPRSRRKGAAANMMRKAACWAASEGAEWFALAVLAGNEPANRLYASLGMEIVEQYHYRTGGED